MSVNACLYVMYSLYKLYISCVVLCCFVYFQVSIVHEAECPTADRRLDDFIHPCIHMKM
jgi:hypothetical protein